MDGLFSIRIGSRLLNLQTTSAVYISRFHRNLVFEMLKNFKTSKVDIKGGKNSNRNINQMALKMW